jgi:hypothetical protein
MVWTNTKAELSTAPLFCQKQKNYPSGQQSQLTNFTLFLTASVTGSLWAILSIQDDLALLQNQDLEDSWTYIWGNAIYSSSRACSVMKGHMDKEFILPTNSFGKVVGS